MQAVAPVIGVTATLRTEEESLEQRPHGTFVRADLDYVEGVANAGGVPLVLPPFTWSAEQMAGGLDGLLLSGGSDLDPRHYGELPSPELGLVMRERDEFEMELVGHALQLGIPIFGICRGLQILNVALGGTLYQDLPTQLGSEVQLEHRQGVPKYTATHVVELDDGSAAAKIMGARRLEVNSYHHQAVKELASGLVAVAHSPDGVVEAVEAQNLSERWILGVQWHAEAMRAQEEQRCLFEALVEAAGRHALRRAA